MKKLIKMLMVVALLVPSVALAQTKYESKNLEETFKEEATIESENETDKFVYDLSNYKETDDQVTIYLFRGHGCGYCRRFLTYLNSIVDEYGKYFKLESYEVWYNSNNNKLMKEVADFLEEDAGGVPYIIIGDQVFPGYADYMNESIIKAIMDQYESGNKYDVLEEMKKAELAANATDMKPVIINVIAIVVATSILITYMHSNNKSLNIKINNIEKELVAIKKNQNDAKSEAKKEETTKTKTAKAKTTKAKKKTDEK